MTREQRLKIRLRIACPEAGYPYSEARYSTVIDWQVETGLKFEHLLREEENKG